MQRGLKFWILWVCAIIGMSACGMPAKKRDGMVLGALAGALAGGGIGAGIGPEASDNEDDGRAKGIAIGAAAGAVLGGMIGYALAEEEPPPPPPPPDPCEGFTLEGDILFDFDSSDIRLDAEPVLNEVAERLTECPAVHIKVEGHTDSRGSEAYNQALSERRAAAVAGYLEARGVAAERLDSVGMGEGVPIEPNRNPDGSDNPDGRAKNRRVVLTPR